MLQGQEVPQGIYEAWISVALNDDSSSGFDPNRQYWLKNHQGQLQALRLDYWEPKPAPEPFDDIALELDEQTYTPVRLYAGDNSATATELDHATGQTTRIRAVFGLG